MADEKKPERSREDRRAKMYDKAKATEKKVDPEKKAAPAPAKDSKDAEPGLRAAMHKRHEGERRDFHGNMRDSMRKMVERHEKEINELQAAEQGEQNGGADTAGAEPTLSSGAEGAPAEAAT